MKKNKHPNKRSIRHKREKYGRRARILLDSYAWETEERILLEMMAARVLEMNRLRQLGWDQVSFDRENVILAGEAFPLSDESRRDIAEAREAETALGGEPRDHDGLLFRHVTGKNGLKALDTLKE